MGKKLRITIPSDSNNEISITTEAQALDIKETSIESQNWQMRQDAINIGLKEIIFKCGLINGEEFEFSCFMLPRDLYKITHANTTKE